jgi:dTDP-4-dehydrorhamnose reductase
MEKMKSIIIGSDGLIGSRIIFELKKKGEFFLSTSYKTKNSIFFLDISKPDFKTLDNLISESLDFAIISAGISQVAKCEREKEYSYACNVDGTLAIAKYFADRNITPILFSSDYVFDGENQNYTETSCTNPINNYGRQKAIIEEQISYATNNNFLLLRLSKVFTEPFDSNKSLTFEISSSLKKNQIVFAAYDQIFCPIYIGDLIKIIFELQQINAKGLFNICSENSISRYDLAFKIAKNLNIDTSMVKKISIDDLNKSFKMPKNLSMCCKKLKKTIPITFTSIENLIFK